ncbi:Zinc finger CCHC domain-containing protein 7 [Trachymyrmex septentrionalis]|uniref:Zinc finger CCHC domain-containing protein 7 n=1 Tax=Trachymyrmex septentrionalis TaxID=34720 RepID=A0A195F1N5_9HYME|nr:Zinc finger CCHC domain-containing protein 7 [Trachymyrmex septentrionalis]
MSGNIIEKNNSFDDYYNTDNFNDSELQARLYAEIYYESNIEGASETTDSSRTIKFDSMTTETNVESKRIQYESGEQYLEQPLTSKTTGADSQKMPSTHQSEFVQVETMSSREINSAHGNKSSEDPSVVQEKEKKENSSKKHKFSKHVKTAHKESSDKNDNDMEYSKYNVVSKCVKQKVRLLLAEQMDKEDSSDSEKSIFEVPIPLKPEPPLIDLQDSDEENESNSEIDNDLIFNHNGASLKTYLKARPLKNCELEILQSNPQDTSSKSKTTSRSYNKDTVNSGKSIQTSTGTQDIMEDIVLNCTTIQRGAKSISEIKQLSKSIEVKQRSKSTENTSQNSKKTLPFLKGNNKNTNLQQEISVTPGKKLQIMQRNIDKSNNMYFTHLEQNRSSVIEPCNPVIDRKRRCNEIDDQSKQKRRCTSQQNNQNIMSQSSSTGEKRNMSNEFFEPMSEEMKNYYNLNRGQENFDIRKLQQSMSKDPRMWAILDEDLMPCPSSKRFRFWNVKCTNCQQDGHRRYDCPTPLRPPSCYMCGTKGHAEVRCPQKMCLTCGKPQNTFRNTCEYCRLLYCTMCDSVGHEQNQCPDLWRRYHQTTDMSSMPQDPGNVMKPSKLLYCCNCTKRGHESSTCREYRWSENFPTPAAVTNYTDGPIYRSSSPHVSSYPGPDSELDLSLSETTENEISIPQYTIDTQQTITTEDVESSANVDTSSNINFYISPISQEVISQTKVLLAKANIEFEVNIGYIHRKILSLQLIAMKDYIEPLYDLLKYWLNLPEDEKDYGIDVDLPVSCMKMLNVLLSREPQLNKMRFRHYFDYIGGLDHPRLILTSVNSEKIKVENHCKLYGNQRTQKKYNRLRRNLFRLQTKLLVITNTEPEPNVYVRTFQDIMRRFKSGFYQTNAKLDTVTYLRLNLLYNQLFVPHTSENLHRLLQRIELEEKKFKDSQQPKLEICHVPEKEQQESEIHHILANQENLICTSTADTSSTTLCTSPNINSDNFFVIDNQQNNEILNDEPNVNNTLLETNKLINRNYDDITITIKTPLVQVSEIIPLNTAPMPSVKSKELKPNEDFIQLSTSEEIDSNVSKNKQNINVNNTPHLSKKEKKKLNYLKLIEMRDQNIYDIALNIIKTARALKVPHMMKAADEIQRQVNKRTVKAKHLRSLSKLIRTEQNHQKAVTNFCNFLKKK